MDIKVKCGNCGKGYQVDVKLAGKKARCKKCGQSFLIQMFDEDSEGGGGDLLAGLASAAESERRAAPAAVAAPVAGGGAKGGGGCPSCGAAMSAEAVLCVNCGYNRASGGRMRTVMETEVARETPRPAVLARRDGGGGERRDSSGVRVNEPYRNTFLNIVDQAVPEICTWLFGLAIALQFIGIVAVGRVSIGMLVGAGFALALIWALFFGAFVPVVLHGLAFAGKLGKFEVPENPFKRLLAVYFCSSLAMLIAVFIGGMGAMGSASLAGPRNSPAAVNAAIAALRATAVLALLAYVPINFLLFKFFFRLKFVEAIIGWIFLIIFTILGAVVFYVVLLLIMLAIAAVAGSVASAS